jgi:hypothetical protein
MMRRQPDVDHVGSKSRIERAQHTKFGISDVHVQLPSIATALLYSYLPSVHPDMLANQEPKYFWCATLA